MIGLLALALLAAPAEKPTEKGDPIGVASLDAGGRLTLQLRSVQCDGLVVEGFYTLAPTDKNYVSTLAWVGR